MADNSRLNSTARMLFSARQHFQFYDNYTMVDSRTNERRKWKLNANKEVITDQKGTPYWNRCIDEVQEAYQKYIVNHLIVND